MRRTMTARGLALLVTSAAGAQERDTVMVHFARRRYECGWPDYLVPHLERYLREYRPSLLAGRRGHEAEEDALWISSRGIVLDESTLAQAIEVRTRKAFGRHINTHLFRRIVATEIAMHDPDNATDIAAILGHSSIEVSEKYYNFARALEAARAYHELIIGRVGGAMRPGRAPSRQPSPLTGRLKWPEGFGQDDFIRSRVAPT